jgi:hypothetical protein
MVKKKSKERRKKQHRRIHSHKRRQKQRKKKGKKMPANVIKYFKLVNQGMSKAEARKEAGLPKSKGKRKKWGPGHPLYDWQKKHKR